MVILHDAVKQFTMGFCFFLKKEQKPAPFKEKQKNWNQKNKKQVGCFFKKTGFSQP